MKRAYIPVVRRRRLRQVAGLGRMVEELDAAGRPVAWVNPRVMARLRAASVANNRGLKKA